ncbi:MAG: response regulator [Holophagales bacterium]|nr:response regulator [Holophagales bacterium]MYG31627.1 response regulator [Holophagales bacterium]MYI78304.1 response regulator [Holophagales bacterium]
MTKSDDPNRQNQAPRDRVSTLIAAIRRISASLDLDTVLGEVVESARVLTGARKGVIVILDEEGVPHEPLFSGLTPEEEREQLAWPGNARLFEHLRNLDGPVRVADFPRYVHALGIESPWTISQTFASMPMRHRGMEAGSFSLAEKADGEAFTGEDEEVLALFASQAASAIANARTYHSERRVRADLEALIETSPVGVVVFDAKSGRPVSINREMRRIAESLRTPGQPPEQLLEVLSIRRADGSEMSLSEFPIAQQLSGVKTLRAEEMVLSVPDGRSIRTLIDAAPVPADGDAVGSVVVTVQDLAPLDEIERLRTEFLGLVSHELRGPLAAIKGSAMTLLDEAPALDPAEAREFHRLIVEQADHMRRLVGDLLDAGHIEAGTLSVSPEPSAVADLVERARNTFVSGGARQGVVVDLPPDLPRVMADRRRVAQVLNNLLANAARHAPETSAIRVSAAVEDGHVAVSVSDEGQGLAPERLAQLFRKHIAPEEATARRPSHGLGLAICKGLVEAHGGRIRAESAGPGRGTTVVFTLPVVDGDGAEAGGPSPDRPAPNDGPGATRILVVDDDPRMLRLVRDALAAAGYAPVVTGEPGEVARLLREEKPALAVLDLALPGADGIELMRETPELSDLPVIFISVYGRDETVARALDAGAADYIVKPFSPTELAARVRAALRRQERPAPFVLGELSIDYESRRVTVEGRALDLTATEFDLLRVLSLNAGRVMTYATLLRQVWGKAGSAGPNRVRVFVRSLRRKLGEDAERPTWIFNERGVGYRMPDAGEG